MSDTTQQTTAGQPLGTGVPCTDNELIDKKKRCLPAEWHPRTMREIASRTFDSLHTIPWVIKDVLAAQSGLLCSGHPHAGKSLNWLAACVDAVVTHKVWGQFDAKRVKRVLFIETEDPAWLVENRVVGLMRGHGLKSTADLEKFGFYFVSAGPFNLVDYAEKMHALIDHVKPDFMVLSTLQGLVGERSLSEQKDMSAVNALLVSLQKRAPLVVITHSPRDSSAERALGTITQDANYLSLMHFKKKVSNGEQTIVVTGDSKLGTELSFDLKLAIATVKQDGEDITEVRRVLHFDHVPSKAEAILEYLEANPKAKPVEVAKAVECTEQYARKIMKAPEQGFGKAGDKDDPLTM